MTNDRTRIALVTGANRGLGYETVRQLLSKGLKVVLSGRDEDSLAHAAATFDQDKVMTVLMDVTDESTIEKAQETISSRFGAVDILVNNAAILVYESEDALSIPPEGYRQTFDTNIFGVIEVCRVFIPAMARGGYGRIVNVSSGAGQLASMSTYAPAYSLSKAALNAWTRILASSYRESGVLVNSVDPGWVRTDMGGPSAPRSVEQGADTITWLATLPDDGPTGEFFHDRHPIAW
jgi:NAD(P)-dependent dehydrogenase (short-subunit alcohol dehydrogenase family)